MSNNTAQTNNSVTLDFFKGTGLPEEKELYIKNKFEEYLAKFNEWKTKIKDLKVDSVEDTENMELAKQARLALVKVRTSSKKIKDELKADILKEGKIIDTVYKFIEENIKPLEADLLQKEKFIEIQEEKRLDKLEAERKLELSQYTDVSIYNLRELDEEKYQTLLSVSISNHENKVKLEKLETEKKEAEDKVSAMILQNRATQLEKLGFNQNNTIFAHNKYSLVTLPVSDIIAISDEEFQRIFEVAQKEIQELEKPKVGSITFGFSKPNVSQNADSDYNKILHFKEMVSELPVLDCKKPEYIKLEKELLQYKDGIINFIDKQLVSIQSNVA